MFDIAKDLFSKDISEYIPFMLGTVGGKPPKFNVTRLSEVFIPFSIIFYLLFGIRDAQVKIEERITKIEVSQSVSVSQIKDLRKHVGGITQTLQKIGFAKLVE
jgi:hypothetical protein